MIDLHKSDRFLWKQNATLGEIVPPTNQHQQKAELLDEGRMFQGEVA